MCILRREGNRSEKSSIGVTPTLGHPRKCKTMETEERSVVGKGWGTRDEQVHH